MFDEYEKKLKEELWLCHKHMSFSMEEIERMPIQDRKYYVKLHNKSVEKEKQEFESRVRKR